MSMAVGVATASWEARVSDFYFERFRRFSMLLLVIERVAASPRVRALTFHSESDQLVGRISLDAGMVGIAAEVEGDTHIDEAFFREGAPVAPTLQKLLMGQPLSVTEGLQLHNIPLIARRCLCGVTARALRRISELCDLGKIRMVEQPNPTERLAGERYFFSVVELLLAAGRHGSVRYTDSAARLYETPPGSTEERWLFEWQPDGHDGPWPIMTTRMAERKANTVAQFGMLGQGLAQYLLRLPSTEPGGISAAALGSTAVHSYYVVCSEKYVVLLIYQNNQLDRLYRSLEGVASASNVSPSLFSNQSALSPSALAALAPLSATTAAALSGPATAYAPKHSHDTPPSKRTQTSDRSPVALGSDEAAEWLLAAGIAPTSVEEVLDVPAKAPPLPDIPPRSDLGSVAREPKLDSPPRETVRLPTATAETDSKDPPGPAPAAERGVDASANEPPTKRTGRHDSVAQAAPLSDKGAAPQRETLAAPPSETLATPPSPSIATSPSETPAEPLAASPSAPLPTPPSQPSPETQEKAAVIEPVPAFDPSLATQPLLVLRGFSASYAGRAVLPAIDLCIPRRGLHTLHEDDRERATALMGILSGRNRAATGWSFDGEARFDDDLLGRGMRPAVLGPTLSPSSQPLRRYLLQDLLPAAAHAFPRPALQARLSEAGLAHLGPFLDSPLGQPPLVLSQAEWWHLAIARELVSEPKLLCLHDPQSGHSPSQAAALIELLVRESTRRAVLLLAPHSDVSQATPHTLHSRLDALSAPPRHLVEAQQPMQPTTNGDPFQGPGALQLTPVAAPQPTSPLESQRSQPQPAPDLPAGEPTRSASSSSARTDDQAPLLQLRSLSASLRGRELLPPLSLTVGRRGLHLLVCRSDTHRRLLLRVLCGPLSPLFAVQGSALYAGRDLVSDRSALPVSPLREARWLLRAAREYLDEGSHSPPRARARSSLPSLAQRIEQVGFPELLPQLQVALCDLHAHERRLIEIVRCASLCPDLLVLEDPLHGIHAHEKPRLLQLLQGEAEQRAILILAASAAGYGQDGDPPGPFVTYCHGEDPSANTPHDIAVLDAQHGAPAARSAASDRSWARVDVSDDGPRDGSGSPPSAASAPDVQRRQPDAGS